MTRRRAVNNVAFSGEEFETFLCMASGPSLTKEDVELVRQWRSQECFDDFGFPAKRKVIVVNTTYQLAPWADYLFANDGVWWRHHIDQVRQEFLGESWTASQDIAELFGLKYVKRHNTEYLMTNGDIGFGHNSGFMAMNLAFRLGASRIVMLGYDMKVVDGGASHWHGDHPANLYQSRPDKYWIRAMGRLADGLQAVGIPVVNASRDTALTCFQRMDLEEVLAG